MAVTVFTTVVFSGTLAVLVDVNTGLLSLTGVTVTRMACTLREAAVAGLDDDDVDIVAVGVGRRLEVRRRE